MSVRLKFKVQTVTPSTGQVDLWPVCSGSPENDEFYRLTPGGSIRLVTINEKAVAFFQVGKEYYVDFTLAP